MAKKYVNASSRSATRGVFTAAAHQHQVGLLARYDYLGITALLDKADVQKSDRTFILSMHIFLQGPRGDAKILRLAEAWLELAPRLLSVAGGRRELIEWVSEAAKAYAMLSAAATQVRPNYRLP
jgi:hypothetical protein